MATDTKAKGYKGHRAGSARERAHKLVDENPKAERKDLIPKIVKFGVTPGTATNWISVFRKGTGSAKTTKPAAAAKKPAPKKAILAKKPAPKPAAVAAKKPAVKTKPSIKPSAPAVESAAPTAE